MEMMEVSVKEVQKILAKDSSLCGKYKSHEIVPWSDKPIGYLADHFRLRIHFEPAGSKDFFFKALPKKIESRVEYLTETGIFDKEVKVYETLIPKLLDCSSISWAPKCYLAKEENFIILEVLQDFKIKSTQDLVFDFDHLKIAAKTLATFHAASLIYERRSGRELWDEFTLEENAYPLDGKIRRKGLENAIEVFLELVRLIPSYQNSPKLNEIIKKLPDTFRKIYKFVQPSKKFKNVFSHGDLWVNNFMFKYDDNDKPIACKFVDFQLARYSPPAMDLAELVYINSTKKVRSENLDDILNTYCDAFEGELMNANVIETSFNRTEILESFREYHLAGLIEAALFSQLTMLPSDTSTAILSSSEEYDKFLNQSRVATCLKAFEENYYRERLTEILTEIIEKFILRSDC